jgi:hypothetical protein
MLLWNNVGAEGKIVLQMFYSQWPPDYHYPGNH